MRRSLIFLVLVVSLSIANIISPIKTFSSKENRYLQTLPEIKYESITSGRFSKDFETFATDQFIGRDKWISLKTISDLALLKKDNTRAYFGKDGYLFEVDKDMDYKQFDKNMANINLFLDKLGKDVLINALLVASKETVLNEKLPPYAPIVDEEDLLDKIKSALNKSINIMDTIDLFEKKSNEYIYYRTDHHWTSEGAYYAYEYYLKSRGKNPLGQGEFEINKVSDKFLGTTYRKANFYMYEPDDIYVYRARNGANYNITINNDKKNDTLYDESFLSKTDKYSYFLGGDKPIIEIDTSVKNGQNLLVIKDSFANSLIPFMVNHYEKIIVIDTRYFAADLVGLIKEKEVGEVLFLFNIQNFSQEKTLSALGR